jgi:beta-glucosidase
MLAHGMAVQAYRAHGLQAPIGIALNIDTPRPATVRREDKDAVDRCMDLPTRFFLNALLGKPYPERHFKAYPDAAPPPVKPGDVQIMATPIDFLGLNFYTEAAVAAAPEEVHPERFRRVPVYHDTTHMGWPITPRGLYRQLQWVWNESGGRWPLYITENGCAVDDHLSSDGMRCHDPERIAYLRGHLSAALDAIRDGVDLRGYFLWSFIDNFEWSFGYTKRFGIVYADYIDQRRVPKDSFYFYREVISGAEQV